MRGLVFWLVIGVLTATLVDMAFDSVRLISG
jgi:hypothetical protein